MQIEEFCKSAPAQHLKHPDEGVYLVWKWDWALTNQTLSFSECFDAQNSGEESVEEGQQQSNSSVLETVRFKVIGTTRDKKHQDALEAANEVLQSGEEVQVSLRKEPRNPVDSMAIAFTCFVQQKWQRIGYVVREALNDVHEAISTNSIRAVKLAWVKFRIDFYGSGPGFYAGVDITRQGRWSSVVHASASTK